MKLITIDPRLLRDNPDNPRRTKSTPEQDATLLANVRAVGILQPPTARERNGEVYLIAGQRRRDAAIAAELPEIHVLIREPGDDPAENGDGVRALSENMVRAGMTPVDQWRSIEALIGDDWTEDAIAAALNVSVRRLRALRLLAKVHPAMLDQMARGDMPSDGQLRIVALAARDEQASVWKKLKPKKTERAPWNAIAGALEKRRMSFSVAKFGNAEAEAFGVHWEDDLFAPADQETRYTTQVAAFMQAQTAWLGAHLPRNGVVLETGAYGDPKLPPKAVRVWHNKPAAKDHIGCFVNPHSGAIEQVLFQFPQPAKRAGGSGGKAAAAETYAKPPRPDLSQKGAALVGGMRTDALHTAFEQAEISDQTLIGLLVLALAGQNVSIRSADGGDSPDYSRRGSLAARITEGGVLTSDPDTLRAAARAMLRQTLSCRVGYAASGMVARYAGIAVEADRFLPTTATEEFLANLSKPAVEATARSVNVLPRNTGKATRAAIVEELAGQTFLHPLVSFALTDQEQRREAERRTDLSTEADEEEVGAGADPDGGGEDGTEQRAPGPGSALPGTPDSAAGAAA